MNLLKTIIERLNQRIEVANIFDKQFGLCELNANGNEKAWVHYIGNGQAEVVTNFDAKQGTLFWAKRGKVTVVKTDAYKVSGCKQLYITSFPLTAYAVVRKSHLPCDAEDAQDWLASRIYKITSGTDPLFKQSIGVINFEVIPSGYINEIKTLTAHYEWACVSVDFDIQVITTTEDGCYDICQTGDIPLPDLPACTPCLTEVAVDGVTIIGNGTAADPLSAIGAGGGAIVVQDEGVEVTPVATTLNFTGAGVTASLISPGVVEVNVPGGGSGGVTSVSGTAPIASSGGSTPDISISQASTSTDGYLSQADWDTFNGKFDVPTGTNADYLDGTGAPTPFPTIPAAQVNSDWNSVSGVSEILNKPTIPILPATIVEDVTASAPIASSGGTNPDISISQADTSTDGYLSQTDWNTFDGKFNVPTGTITDYLDGLGSPQPFPTIPNAQVNSDWNSTSGVSEILNKPTIPILPATIVESVSGTAPIASSGGVTPDISITQADGSTDGYLSSTDWSTFNGKFDVPTGTNADYLDGTGTPTLFPTIPTGTVTSVDLTMPVAFTVTGNPVTSSGTLAVAAAGVATQYIRGDGQLANFPTSSGGGSSVSYYLNGSVAQGTLGGVAFKQMSGTPVIGAGTDFTINADGYIQSFITDASVPNQLAIPAGNWNFEMYFSSSSAGGTPRFYIELYKLSAGTLTLLASNSANPEFITNGTAVDLYTTAVSVPSTVLLAADRLAIRVYVIHSSKTITLHTEDNHLCQVITTFSTGLTSLNGLTVQTQLLAVGTSGTDFAISSATDTHTFNLPTASASKRGALSSADWTTFNSKGSGTITSVTGTAPIASSGGATPAISIADAAADGTTKGAAAFTAADFNATAGLVSIDYTNGQAASASAKGFLTSADWTTFNGKQAAITPAALTKVDDTNVTLTLGGTPTTALLQAASITAGWSGTLADARITSAATWNAKQNAITLTTTGTSGAATLTGATLNIPQYASGAGLIYKSTTDSVSFLSILNTVVYTQLISANTFTAGDIIRITYRTKKLLTNGAQTLRIYSNATADLSGTPLLLGAFSSLAVSRFAQIQRHLVIKSSTNNTETATTAFSVLTDIVNTGDFSTIALNWTNANYIVFALQNASALDTNYGSMYLIEKL